MAKAETTTMVEITPQMIEAGIVELRRHCIGEPIEEVIRDVFLMMALESAAFADPKG
jgi:hypothetical protein